MGRLMSYCTLISDSLFRPEDWDAAWLKSNELIEKKIIVNIKFLNTVWDRVLALF